jgi:radical SAM superfamily enzyme YgiQ (UPF0313 family)
MTSQEREPSAGRLDTTRTLRPSASLAVAVKAHAVLLPRYGYDTEITLDLAQLRLMESLAADRDLDLPDADTADFLAALAARNLVSRGGADLGPSTPISTGPAVPEEARGPSEPSGAEVVLASPLLLRCGPHGFDYVDHEGVVRARLDATQVLTMVALCTPATRDEAWIRHQADLGADALSEPAFDDLLARLAAAGLLVPFDPDDPLHAPETRQAEVMRDSMRRQAQVNEAFDRIEAERAAADPRRDRVPVIGVHQSWSGLPASLAVIIAAAKAHDEGALEQSFDFRPRLFWDRRRLESVSAGSPGIFLFSNYIWSTDFNLAQSAFLKERNPHHVTVHGGPNTPKYLGDVERFFAANPHVDIAVHGEGEATFAAMLAALRGSVGDGPPDLSVLGDVAGLSFRHGHGVVQTADRERIADIDAVPSPILTGIYDGFIPAGPLGAVIMETNRGCPYGCTFCDWGSATLSRVRKFDLDRIFAELEWCAHHQFETVGIADANFGIFERDVEIAQKIADLKATYGYPRFIGNNYAKNTVKHLSSIIEIFTEAGIVAEGKMSMQTFDEGTLTTIRRKNIKVEKYHELSTEFRRNDLPMVVDIMMGLPGSTPVTFRNDLQECLSRAVRAAIHSTILLTNSPMNEPAYRLENAIVALPGEEVKETSSFTRQDWEVMNRLTLAYYVFENFGVLRQVATYVHAETGQREIDFYERFVDDVHADPDRWPVSMLAVAVLPELMVPPVSWKLFLDEVREYLVERVGLADDAALDTVLTVQHALLPARGRHFPLELALPHDFVSWFAAVGDLRDQGQHHDWHLQAPRLRDLGPGPFRVDDPFDVCTRALGGSLRSLVVENAWDLDSAVSRPRQRLNE